MVQQAAYAAATSGVEWPQPHQQLQIQPQPQLQSNGIQTMPAIVGAAVNQHQPSQYSPQQQQDSNGSSANFYQQQLIKSAQQQFAHQQQHRMNGTSVTLAAAASEGLYNGVASVPNVVRPAPIYAPKPTYYSQQQHQQQQQQPQPVYQQTRAFYAPQQQHSPVAASLGQQLQQHQAAGLTTATGLSVRQLPATNAMQQQQHHQHQQIANGTTAMLSQQNSPQSNHMSAAAVVASGNQQVQSSELQRNQQQQQHNMQHLIMSYQQQQQPFNNQMQQQQLQRHPDVVMQQNYAHHNSYNFDSLQQQEANRRSQIEEQHRLIQQQHLRQSAAVARAARISDRDSVSTVSRLNQFDDRRSFTMRSQYTSANNAAKYSRNFGFLELTSEAIKRILGLADNSSNNKSRLLSPGASIGEDGEQRKNNHSLSSAAKITSIDSGEDYYFKRKVFKYQLIIVRFVSFLCAAFVLLSPVAMLLIPKLESILHNQADFGAGSGIPEASATALSAPPLARGSAETAASPSVAVVTHGVGLTGTNKHQQVNYLIPQPQWRISECTSDCDGPLIGFSARFIMLCIAYWAIFFRSQTSSLPRIDFQRCLLISIAVLLTLAYWLFFIFRVFDKRYNDFELQYMTIVQFALSMLESLILLHYLAVVLLELRERKKIYCLKVVRSPDGASQYLSCGSLSIQKCAQFVLEKYHREFQSLTPYHEHLLELEDELAKNLSSSAASRDRGGDKSPLNGRSRANSPATSTHGAARSSRHDNQLSTLRPSRHHSRANSTQHRSPSRSPIRSSRGGRSRSRRKLTAAAEAQQPTIDQQQQLQNGSSKTSSSQVKLYQVDLNPPAANNQEGETLQEPSATNGQQANPTSNNNNSQEPAENKESNAENDSADQSSDATSRMKESSLETIRAANSTSELLSSQQQQQKSASAKQQSSSRARSSGADQEQSSSTAKQQRDETESVRSVRSRRSTSRSQHRHREHHHHHHRERSSSRMNEHHSHQEQQSGHDDRRRSNAISIPMSGADDPLEEHERKLRRRKYRLLMAVQDTFEQIRQIDEAAQNGQHQQQQVEGSSTSLHLQQQPSPVLSPNQAARSLYPSMARSLQKYLRLTKQTGRHNLQSIYDHLSKCLLYRLSPRAFLEKFINQDPVWQQSETNLFARCRLQTDSFLMNDSRRFEEDLEINSWSLVCDTLLSRQIDSGTFFVLKQGQVSLLVTVAKLPHLNLTEEVIDQKSCKFALAPNSETSV